MKVAIHAGYETDGRKSRTAKEDAWALAFRKTLPVYIAVGEHDPAHGQLALVNALVERLQSAGLHDVTLKTYPAARHEVFNETNRDEVYADLVAWMNSKVHQAV